MKKIIALIMKKACERAAHIPVNVRSWPYFANQPKMPKNLRANDGRVRQKIGMEISGPLGLFSFATAYNHCKTHALSLRA